MASAAQVTAVSKGRLWTSYTLSTLLVFLMIFNGVVKIMKPQPVVEGFAHFGYPESIIAVIGMVEILCALLYIIPKTSVLGAIFVTGYLGGATATHARVLDWNFVIPFLTGVLAWLALFLRDGRIRALIPLKND